MAISQHIYPEITDEPFTDEQLDGIWKYGSMRSEAVMRKVIEQAKQYNKLLKERKTVSLS